MLLIKNLTQISIHSLTSYEPDSFKEHLRRINDSIGLEEEYQSVMIGNSCQAEEKFSGNFRVGKSSFDKVHKYCV